MSRTIELEYDDHTMVCADVREVDESFDHDFGFEVRTAYELENVSIIVYIGDMDYDVTKALSPKELQYFEEWAHERFVKRMGGES